MGFWQYESRRERRQRQLEQLGRLAEAARPRVREQDYEGAAELIRPAPAQTDYQKRLNTILHGGKPAPAEEQPKPGFADGIKAIADSGAELARYARDRHDEEKSKGGGGLWGKVKHVGGEALDALDTASETTFDMATTGMLGVPINAGVTIAQGARDLVTGRGLEQTGRRALEGYGKRFAGLDLASNAIEARGDPRGIYERQHEDFSRRPVEEKLGIGLVFDPTNALGAGLVTKGLKGAALARQGTMAGRALGGAARANSAVDAIQGGVMRREAVGAGLSALASDRAGGDAEQNLKVAALGALGANLTRGKGSVVSPDGPLMQRIARSPLRGMGGSITEDVSGTPFQLDRLTDEAADGALTRADVPQPALIAQPEVRGVTNDAIGEVATANGRRYTVPEIGTDAALKAVADKDMVLAKRGPSTSIWRKGMALLNPSLAQDRGVYVAYNARQSVKASLRTQFDAVMEPVVQRVEAAMKAAPAQYIGPENNPIRGTFKDIADHPDHYVIPPELRAALDEYDMAQWDQVSSVARARYGVDVAPYDSGIEGAIYTPTVVKRDAMDTKVDAASMGLSRTARTKERAYAGAFDRIAKHPGFIPETDIRELTALHNSAMASNSANETFRLGAGGKSRIEVLDETHPGLRERKEKVRDALKAARGALQTSERQGMAAGSKARLLASQAKAIEKRMGPLEERVADLGADYGPELSHLSGELRQLRIDAAHLTRASGEQAARKGAKQGSAAMLTKKIDALQDELDDLVTAYKTANPEPYVYDPASFRYYSPEAAKTVRELGRVPEGFTKSALEALDEVRALHLAGDASPLYVQSMIGVFQDPVMAVGAVRKMLGESPRAALSRIAREEADDVAEYTFHTGRAFTEQVGELAAPKGLQRIGPLAKLDKSMFAVVQRMNYEAWKRDRDLLLKLNPGMAREVAGHESANALGKIIPGLNPAERGVSGLRGAVERGVVTSTSFATAPAAMLKDMTSGMAKLAASTSTSPAARWRTLTGREQIAVMRGTTMIGTMLTASVASAALAAESRNMDPLEAMTEALNPKSKYFMAIQVGDGSSVPIGGPFRGFVKALWPGEHNIPGERLPQWVSGKLTSPTVGTYRLLSNKDWQGDAIRDGDAVTQIAQSVGYALEQVAPISIGSGMEGVRKGADPEEILTNSVGQLLGANPSLASTTERLNQIARDQYNGKFYDLEPHQQEAIRTAHPDLWNEAVARGSDARRAAAKVKAGLETEQRGDDADLLSGKLKREDWLTGYRERVVRLRAAQDVIYGDAHGKQRNTPLDRYFTAIDEATTNGRVDWEAVDTWMAGQSEADQAYIDRNTGLGGTELVKRYRIAAKLRSEYYDLPEYRGVTADEGRAINDAWQVVRNNAKRGDDVAMLRALRQLAPTMDPSVVKGVRRRILGVLREDRKRAAFAKAHPEMTVWYGRGPLTGEEAEMLA